MDGPFEHREPAPEDSVAEPAHAPLPAKPEAAPAPVSRRKPLLLLVAAAVLLIGGGYLVYCLIFAADVASTDNAYVGADVAQITPLVGGQIVGIGASDTQFVKRGQVLLRIDDADQRIAVEQARADLAAAERGYAQTAASGNALEAKINARNADVGSAQAQMAVARANLQRAQVDYTRRRALAAAGAASGDELTSATNALQSARASIALSNAAIAQAQATRSSAVQDRAASSALTAGTTTSTAPAVLAARAKLHQAELELGRTVVRAPIDGVVAQRMVQIGQRIAVGTSAMTIVPIGQMFVDANFKEVQLGRVRAGQPVGMTSDLYGDKVEFHGRVVGLGGGTGAAFSLIPAQNATGNWIKVVQRLPVRIALDPAELRAHPLRVGLTMTATVDLGKSN